MGSGLPKDRYIIASSIEDRDGIGIEIYRNDQLIIEIFRDDEKKTRTMTLFKEDIPLEYIEEAIDLFKTKVGWDFQ